MIFSKIDKFGFVFVLWQPTASILKLIEKSPNILGGYKHEKEFAMWKIFYYHMQRDKFLICLDQINNVY